MAIQYRPEIDGLRALAVLPVILFHADFSWFQGGFVGVDIFFVISGYLITSIIFNEIQAGRFSIINFYERRARRILPALFTVCLACIPFAWLWLFPAEFKNFGESLAAVSIFSSNILFWSDTGYFASAAELKPLLHTWSLAVEEQFYLFFPLLLVFCRPLSARWLAFVLLALTCLSLLPAIWASTTNQAANFFLLPTRAWELGVGALIAIALPQARMIRTRWLSTGAAALGLALVVYAVVVFDDTFAFPGAWALVPVLGTAALIVFAHPGNAVGRLLASKPMVAIGLISYSAYLRPA